MAIDGLGAPEGWAPIGTRIFSDFRSEAEETDTDNWVPAGIRVEDNAPEAAFGLAPGPEAEQAFRQHPDFLTFNEIRPIDGLLAAKGGTKGKPTDDGGGGGGGGKGGGGNGGGKGKNDSGGDSGGDATVLTSYVSGGDAVASYNVEIVFDGSWTSALQQAFIDAADYLSSIILGDLLDVPGSAESGGGVIDDIRISASLVYIDGVGGTLGWAGPSAARSDSWLPTEGVMVFDSADAQTYLDAGSWYDIVLHEMLHSIGFGTVWNLMGLTTGSIDGGDLRFTGANAIQAYQNEFDFIANGDPGAALGVPIETDGGSGTAGGHWDEATFGDEIMTGYLDNKTFVSDMTIAALEDMGYDTVYDSLLFA